MTIHWQQRTAGVAIAIVVLFAGCRSKTEVAVTASVPSAAVPNLDAEIARASVSKQPMLILILESGRSGGDDDARVLLDSSHLGRTTEQFITVLLDLNVSRNRASAARFHVADTPMLLCLSSKAVIISRDEKWLTKDLVLKRMDEAVQRAIELDAELAKLEEPVIKKTADARAQLKVADFLQERQNMREAIPHLEAVAYSETADTGLRIRAWVDLARAHLWIAEPEKGRHEAKTLIAVLGPKTPVAESGGKFVLAIQDAKGKRMALARQEFQETIAASPDSVYAKLASAELAKLPIEEK